MLKAASAENISHSGPWFDPSGKVVLGYPGRSGGKHARGAARWCARPQGVAPEAHRRQARPGSGTVDAGPELTARERNR